MPLVQIVGNAAAMAERKRFRTGREGALAAGIGRSREMLEGEVKSKADSAGQQVARPARRCSAGMREAGREAKHKAVVGCSR